MDRRKHPIKKDGYKEGWVTLSQSYYDSLLAQSGGDNPPAPKPVKEYRHPDSVTQYDTLKCIPTTALSYVYYPVTLFMLLRVKAADQERGYIDIRGICNEFNKVKILENNVSGDESTTRPLTLGLSAGIQAKQSEMGLPDYIVPVKKTTRFIRLFLIIDGNPAKIKNYIGRGFFLDNTKTLCITAQSLANPIRIINRVSAPEIYQAIRDATNPALNCKQRRWEVQHQYKCYTISNRGVKRYGRWGRPGYDGGKKVKRVFRVRRQWRKSHITSQWLYFTYDGDMDSPSHLTMIGGGRIGIFNALIP